MSAMQSIMKTRNEKVISLLDEWMSDETGYDENVWGNLKNSIDTNRLSERKRFDDETSDAGYGSSGEDHTSTSEQAN